MFPFFPTMSDKCETVIPSLLPKYKIFVPSIIGKISKPESIAEDSLQYEGFQERNSISLEIIRCSS